MTTAKGTKKTSTSKKGIIRGITTASLTDVDDDMPAFKAAGKKTKNTSAAGGDVAAGVGSSAATSEASGLKPKKTEINIISMPKVGNYTSAYISEWHVAVGDKINEGDVIADLEMGLEEKAFQSRFTGEVLALFAKECDLIYSGKPICVMKCEVASDDNPSNAAETGFALILLGIKDKKKGKVIECLKDIMGIGTRKAEDLILFGEVKGNVFGRLNIINGKAKILMSGISRDLAHVYAKQLEEAGAEIKVTVAANAYSIVGI